MTMKIVFVILFLAIFMKYFRYKMYIVFLLFKKTTEKLKNKYIFYKNVFKNK